MGPHLSQLKCCALLLKTSARNGTSCQKIVSLCYLWGRRLTQNLVRPGCSPQGAVGGFGVSWVLQIEMQSKEPAGSRRLFSSRPEQQLCTFRAGVLWGVTERRGEPSVRSQAVSLPFPLSEPQFPPWGWSFKQSECGAVTAKSCPSGLPRTVTWEHFVKKTLKRIWFGLCN